MAKRKLSRKEIKAPDEFQQTMAKVADFLKDYGAYVVAGLVVVVGALVAGVLISRHTRTAEIEKAVRFFEGVGPVVRSFLQTEKDSQDADKDLEGAIGKIARLREEERGSPLGELAGFVEGLALSRQDPSKAVPRLKEAAEGRVGKAFSFIAWEVVGAVAEKAQRTEDALKAYERMGESRSSLARAISYMHRGDLSLKTKGVEQALEFYEKGLHELRGEPSLLPRRAVFARSLLERRVTLARAGILASAAQKESRANVADKAGAALEGGEEGAKGK